MCVSSRDPSSSAAATRPFDSAFLWAPNHLSEHGPQISDPSGAGVKPQLLSEHAVGGICFSFLFFASCNPKKHQENTKSSSTLKPSKPRHALARQCAQKLPIGDFLFQAKSSKRQRNPSPFAVSPPKPKKQFLSEDAASPAARRALARSSWGRYTASRASGRGASDRMLLQKHNEKVGVPSISILSRDPNLFRKPSKTQAKQPDVEKNDG